MKTKKRLPPALRGGVVFLMLTLLLNLVPNLSAQNDVHYFSQSGHSVRGAFRYFWETNGGLANFGFPITEEYHADNGRIVQYFERARFELAEQNGQYFVELGNLSSELLAGRTYPQAVPIMNTAQRRFIPQTGYIIQYGFKEIWETRGAERIFGWPLSNEVEEPIMDGSLRTVQYFEKVRFEYWPEYAPGQRVVISSLGRHFAPQDLQVWLSPEQVYGQAPMPQQAQSPAQSAQQSTQSNNLPNQNATISPDVGPPGTVFMFNGTGFEDSEQVSVWLNAPDYATISYGSGYRAEDGNLEDQHIRILSDDFQEGMWSIVAQGLSSEHQSIAYFTIDKNAPEHPKPPPPPIPEPDGECRHNDPDPEEGLQVWMSEDEPELDDKTSLCVRYIKDGYLIRGVRVEATVRFTERDKDIGPEETEGDDGVAELRFTVDSDDTDEDDRVWVDVDIEYADEKEDERVSFIPRD